MWKTSLTIFLAISCLSAFENELRLENSNFTISQASLPQIIPTSQNDRYLYNYDRLRIYDTIRDEKYFVTAILDLVNYAGSSYTSSTDFQYLEQIEPDIPFDTRTSFQHYGDDSVIYAKIYRLYTGYADEKNSLIFGIQKISMGVGHIWTPTDLYNPKNSLALEPDEVPGVMALNYSYSPSSVSTFKAVVSMKKNKKLKYALGYKTFLGFADVGINMIYSVDVQMYGYEIEGDFFDTGAQWRSEGGYYKSKSLDSSFYQAIIGFDYAFKNGVNWTMEGYYSSKTFSYLEQITSWDNDMVNNMVQSHRYLGTSLSYDFNLVLSGSLLMIGSLDKYESAFIVPTLTYTINDNHKVSLGGMLTAGTNKSEFGMSGNTYYLNWKWSF